jgi:phage-related tail fiber protein
MARYNSTVTDIGAAALTALMASDMTLTLTRAAAGDGIADVSPNTLTDLVHPVTVQTALSGKELVDGDPPQMRVPVQVTNQQLTAPVYVREIAVYGNDIDGNEIMFIYAWLDGEDSDNLLPPTGNPDGTWDSAHEHELAVIITNAEAAAIVVQLSPGSFVTYEQMVAYAAEIVHRHPATQIDETTGETTEEAQRRQDFAIQALQELVDTGFTGTIVIHTFMPAELQYWTGYDGDGLPEGILDPTTHRLYL